MNKNLKPAIVLGVICLVVAILIGGINLITAPEMERQLIAAANKAKAEVLPSANVETFGENILSEIKTNNADIPEEITAIYKADTGYVFESNVKGHSPNLIIMCGISNDGKITGVKDVANGETKDFWAKAASILIGEKSSYKGTNASNLTPQLVSGATESSTGIYSAVKVSVKTFNIIKGNATDEEEKEPVIEDITTPKVESTVEEILARAKAMYDGEVTLESYDVYRADPTTVAVYKNSADGSFVFHLATRTQYTPLETEALILVDSTGKVLKVEILNWVVGHGVDYTPEYLNSFIGKNKYHTDDIDIVAGATGTSNNLIIALKNALFDVFGSISATDEEIDELAYKVIPYGESLEKMELPENSPETVKKMYRIKSGRGYVFFVSTKTQYAPVETEAFVYTDINGKVMNVYIASWVVGHNVYPSDSYVDGLKGKTIEQLRGQDEEKKVDQVAGATGTSAHLEHAIADALTLVPEHTNYSLIGIIAISVVAVISISVAVISFLRRRVRR